VLRRIVGALCLCVLTGCAAGEGGNTVYVAAASNFSAPASEIADRFTRETGSLVSLSVGATGQLFAQITQEAPFEVFLSADQETPRELVARGLGEDESIFTYAVGQLVVYSRVLDLEDGEIVLRSGGISSIALASPDRAPYGRAAMEVLASLGLVGASGPRLVEGNNVAQTFQFVESGAAELGFVARSQVTGAGGSVWEVPIDLYSPIRQDAILLTRARSNETARAFMAFLALEVDDVLARYGYVKGR
jgi:molybdate transport system substrate-binding protein